MFSRFIGCGSLTWDLTCLVSEPPMFERSVHVQEFKATAGGPIGNVLTFLARYGADAECRGAVGNDDAGNMIYSAISSEGVVVRDLRIQPGATSRVTIVFVDKVTARRGFIFRPDTVTPDTLKVDDVSNSDLLLFDEATSVAIEAATRASELGGAIGFIGGWVNRDQYPHRLLELASVIIVSTAFISDWMPGVAVENAFERLTTSYRAPVKILTLGERGGLVASNNTVQSFTAYNVQAVDTCGAGDAFAAGFLYSQAANASLQESLSFASAAAALNVRQLTASAAPRDLAEVRAFLNDHGPTRLVVH